MGPGRRADKEAYRVEVQRLIASAPNIDVIAGTVDDLLVSKGRAIGVLVPPGSGVVRPRPDREEDATSQAPRSIYAAAPDSGDVHSDSVRLLSSAVVLDHRNVHAFTHAYRCSADQRWSGG